MEGIWRVIENHPSVWGIHGRHWPWAWTYSLQSHAEHLAQSQIEHNRRYSYLPTFKVTQENQKCWRLKITCGHVRWLVSKFKRRGFVTLVICKALILLQLQQTAALLMLIDSSSKRKVCKDSKGVVCIPVFRRSAGLSLKNHHGKDLSKWPSQFSTAKRQEHTSVFNFAVIRMQSLMLQGYMHSLKFLEQKVFQLDHC